MTHTPTTAITMLAAMIVSTPNGLLMLCRPIRTVSQIRKKVLS